MKKTAYLLLLSAVALTSCDMFEVDNYDAPEETVYGSVVDEATGRPVLTDQGSEGIRVRMTQLDFSENAEHNPDFYCRMDGTFQNTKVFEGLYNITVDGPFVPIVRTTASGEKLADGSKEVRVKGRTNVEFKVKPFLNVELTGKPTVAGGVITASVKVTRGVSREEFKSLVEPMGNYDESFPNVTDIQLLVSYSSTVGYRARDERWSSHIDYSGDSFEKLFGTPVTITSTQNAPIPSGRHVWVRAAARINYGTPVGSGTRRWNYSEPVEVVIP